MDCAFLSVRLHPMLLEGQVLSRSRKVTLMAQSSKNRRIPKNLRNPRRTKLPPDFGVNLFLKKTSPGNDLPYTDSILDEKHDIAEDKLVEDEDFDNDVIWGPDEIEAISSLFQGRIPQKPGKLTKVRPLPLSLPHKLRPLGLPTPKRHVRLASSTIVSARDSVCKQVYKNPNFLIGLAREISSLSPEEDASIVLNKWARFLRKGSLSLTIRELGRMGLPERALQIFCWAQKQPQLFPDDRILASTVEVLARNHELKLPFSLEEFTILASRGVIEAMARGFIRGGNFNLARKLLVVAKDAKRMLDPSIYAKLILELGKNPDKNVLVLSLLDELGEREDLNLSQQDCTAIMKVCIRLGKFEIAESLFNWYKQCGHNPSVVMYTTLIHSRYCERRYRDALTVVWEMESSNCLFDFPAYRVVIKLFVALNDLPRTVRYFSKLKEAGFSPTHDIYRNLITLYMVSGRLAKCKQICNEAEIAGIKLDKKMLSQLSLLER